MLENRLLAFDNGLCMALPIRKRGLTDIVFNAHSNLSLLDEFNEQFNYDSIHFGTESRQKIKSYKRGLDENINQYITLINHSSYNNLFVKLWYNIKNDWIYYREVKNICFPIIQILWNLARVYCLQILCITFIVVGVNRNSSLKIWIITQRPRRHNIIVLWNRWYLIACVGAFQTCE